MRTNGTKYDKLDTLPDGALPVSIWAKQHDITSPAYVNVKFDRFKFGYKKKDGSIAFGEDPGYRIGCYSGINYVYPIKVKNFNKK